MSDRELNSLATKHYLKQLKQNIALGGCPIWAHTIYFLFKIFIGCLVLFIMFGISLSAWWDGLVSFGWLS